MIVLRSSFPSANLTLPLLPSDALAGESIDSRDKVMDILFPLVFAWFRVRAFPSPFSITSTPRSDRSSPTLQYSFAEQGFDPHILINGTSHLSPRACPPVSPSSPVIVPIEYVGHALHLRLPPIALTASLAYFVRIDAFPSIPVPLPEGQTNGATVEVNIEHYFRNRTVPRGPVSPGPFYKSPSTRHDWDWLRAIAGNRITSGSLKRYTPGILTGKWRGTALVRVLRVPCCGAEPLLLQISDIAALPLALGTIRS